MALIQCPFCGSTVSDKAEQCPHCGRLLLRTTPTMSISSVKGILSNKKNVRLVFLIIGFAAAFLIIWLIMDNQQNKTAHTTSYQNKETYEYNLTPASGKEGAVNKAKSYLNSSAFSYSGLIKQLEFEGFSTSDATYGADHCGADWDEQALKKAQSYIRSSHFSYDSLKDQLEFEGFTSSQAKYGADYCGADWNNEAVEAAKSYLDLKTSWTRSSLIKQLEFEGFTNSQASYGVNHCGGF